MKTKIIIMAVAILMLAACSPAERDDLTSEEGTTEEETVEEEEVAEEETVEEEEEEEEEEAVAQELQVEAGFTSAVNSIDTRNTSFGALITNPNEELAAYDVSVVINLLAEDGSILDTTSENISYLAPNTTLPVAPLQVGFDVPSEPVDYDISIVGEFREDEGYDGVSFPLNDGIELEISDARIEEGSFEIFEVIFTATNNSDVIVEFASWDCVFISDGEIIGGESSAMTDPVAPGASVSVNSMLSVDGLSADEVICHALG